MGNEIRSCQKNHDFYKKAFCYQERVIWPNIMEITQMIKTKCDALQIGTYTEFCVEAMKRRFSTGINNL